MRNKFEIDPNNLDRSAADAFRAHAEKRLGYEEWKAVARRIDRLKGIEAFRREHGDALSNSQHPDHERRSDELQSMFEKAYPDEPAAAP
jgi:hypothetical protein